MTEKALVEESKEVVDHNHINVQSVDADCSSENSKSQNLKEKCEEIGLEKPVSINAMGDYSMAEEHLIHRGDTGELHSDVVRSMSSASPNLNLCHDLQSSGDSSDSGLDENLGSNSSIWSHTGSDIASMLNSGTVSAMHVATILAIISDRSNLSTIKKMLAPTGVTFDTAFSEIQAIEMIKFRQQANLMMQQY